MNWLKRQRVIALWAFYITALLQNNWRCRHIWDRVQQLTCNQVRCCYPRAGRIMLYLTCDYLYRNMFFNPSNRKIKNDENIDLICRKSPSKFTFLHSKMFASLQDVATVPVILDTPLVESSGRSHIGYSRASCLVDPLGNAASGRPGSSGCYVYWRGCQHKEWQLHRFPLVEEDWE